MNAILDEIVANKRLEVERTRRHRPLSTLQPIAEETPPPLSLHEALSKKSPQIIAECKQKSPSKGVLAADYNSVATASIYAANGAAAISVLTDQKYFGGNLDHLRAVKEHVAVPVLRKDFIIDEYQIFEARAAGADSFLLLAGVLDAAQLQYFLEIGRELGMEALVETHSAEEMEIALKTDALILGINNRDLKTMRVDLEISKGLIKKAKSVKVKGRVFVCESGIKQREDIAAAGKVGFDAFLIGETLMTAPDPGAKLRELLG